MKVFVAKTLVESIDSNSCSVNLFTNEADAIKFADKEIDDYAMDYDDGAVMERSPHYYLMQSGDVYVTIEIEEHEINAIP